MAWLLIFYHLEILQTYRIYEDDVIWSNGRFVKICIQLKTVGWYNIGY